MESEESIPKQDEQGNVAWLYAPGMQLKINGVPWEYMNNGQDVDAYLEDAYTVKVMSRINVAHVELPETFELEVAFNKPYQIKSKSYCSNHDGKDTFDLNIDKVIFSPLSSQVVISEKNLQGDVPFDQLAFFDQDGKSLEITTQWVGDSGTITNNKSTNGFEFIPHEGLEKIIIVPTTRYGMGDEVKPGVIYNERYESYQEKYPTIVNIPIEKIPVKINRGPLIDYEILDLQLEKDTMLIKFKIQGPALDNLIKTEIYPLDKNKKWLAHTGIKSLSIDRKIGIYTLRWTNGKNNDKPVDFTKTKYLTIDDGGYLLPEQLLWNQAMEVDVSQP